MAVITVNLQWSLFLELGSCVFSLLVNAPDGDAFYSRIDLSDLDMLKMEPKLLLYDHDSCSDSSFREWDDLKTVTFVFKY